MDIKEFIVKELTKREEIAEPFLEKVQVEEKIDEKLAEADIKVEREVILDYLMKSGFELNEENYARAEEMLSSMQSEKLKETLINAGKSMTVKYKTVNHLNDLSVEELNSLLNVAILNALNSINDRIQPKMPRYEYVTKIVDDRMFTGTTDTFILNHVIKEYTSKGYRIAHIFTNRRDALLSDNKDQVVILFERIIYD
jgi:hypothetical protein